jgi:hypothetical protein
MHGKCGWLYLENADPVLLREWMYDASSSTLETVPPVNVASAVPFRLYPAAAISEIPPPAGDQHFWGVIRPGGRVPGIQRHPGGSEPRELVGRLVRQVWVQWAREQPDPKPSWLLPWEDLDDGQREADMRIGAALFDAGYRAGTNGDDALGTAP